VTGYAAAEFTGSYAANIARDRVPAKAQL